MNALPKALRRYIHDLESDGEIVDLMRENFRLRQEIAALKRELAAKQEAVLLIDRFFFR
jgi:cell division septum initiation protein DivIVA